MVLPFPPLCRTTKWAASDKMGFTAKKESRMRRCFAGLFALAMMPAAFDGVRRGGAEPQEAPEASIRAALNKWTADFNAGNAEEVCQLFSHDLRYDFRGHPERSYTDICTLLRRSLEDQAKKYTYAVQIKEILIGGELAVVRLTWTLRVESIRPAGSFVETIEPGMDIFHKQPDGSWKILRFIAYDE
jgi:ketosteroid isomerase-like protein